MEEIIKIYEEAFSTRFNIVMLGLMIAMLLFWWSAHKWQTPDRVRRRAIFFSPKPTQFLQSKLRSNETLRKILDFATPQVWLWAFVLSLFIEFHICGLQGKEAWRYGVATLFTWGTSMAIQFMFPVIVPIRWDKFDRELPVVAIRLGNFKQSDNVNGLLYNGLPSNHLGMMLVGIILSLISYGRNPWDGYLILASFFLLLAIVFSFSVIYLGEHYVQDLLVSLILFIPEMTIILTILEILVPIA